jgi:UDP-N-acetyl-D-galactosamine dehydrogenase
MIKIAVIGLGYVGLPLARLLATKYPVIGFDINVKRLRELNEGNDITQELDRATLEKVIIKDLSSNKTGLFFTSDKTCLKDANFFIVTVPTPIDKYNNPDLTPLYKASETIGQVLKKGDIVVYESTVYPGVTEEECVPVLERISGLKFNVDFFAGYSPERINPGDKEHTVEKILKVTSGSTPEVAIKINEIYSSVIVAGTYIAPSIKVAEAAKVIENSQRDINIAFVNELSKIFNVLGIDTQEVLKAASTKWNFLPFQPGLVGGHCIGVDPYYLAQKAQAHGYTAEIILAGRKMNDSMGDYVASQVVKLMIQKDIEIKNAKVLILGFTFKENCPDIRNTKVADMIKSFREYGTQVSIYDPQADKAEVKHEYDLEISNEIPQDSFDAVLLAVSHKEFKTIDLSQISSPKTVIFDIKGFLNKKIITSRL